MKKKMKKLLPAIIGGVIGGVAGFFGADYVVKGKGSVWEIVLALLALVIVYYFHVIIHEGGHLIFGLFSGYKFVSFRIGSLILYKSKGEWKLGKYKLAGTGGQCLMAPPELVNGEIPYKLYNMGGALMNVIFSVPAIVVFLLCELNGFARTVCVLWIFIGLFSAATNGIPMSMGEVDNDGKNALSLGNNKKALYAFWLQLKVNQMQMDGKTLLEMPSEWFEKPTDEEMLNSMVSVIGVLHCNRMLEEKRYEETSKLIEELLSSTTGILGLHRMLLQIDQIYCEIMSSQREQVLDSFSDKQLQQFMKAMKNYPSILRTRYAYALCVEKDFKKAEKIKKQFEHIMKSHPNKGELKTEEEFFLDCENTELS